MDIKILDSHLRKFLKTDVKPSEFARLMSLTSVSIERIHELDQDFVYDIEITTNRIDLASAVGIAREASAILPTFGIKAEFLPPVLKKPRTLNTVPLTIENDDSLIYRTLGVVMNVTIGESREEIKKTLEGEDVRSLNNVIDVTNYVMKTIGHPTHVMDYDRIGTGKIVIRPAKLGETVTTLDGKSYTLDDGDLVATDGTDRIIDLIAIMGLENSVVTNDTKRIVFFLDNANPHRIRQTSMRQGIRTDAAQINEKNLDPELAYNALLYGIELFEKECGGKVISNIIDIYPHKATLPEVTVSYQKITDIIGTEVDMKKAAEVLEKLGFSVQLLNESMKVRVPSFRAHDVTIPEDIVEEIARTYGYHNIPSVLPPLTTVKTVTQDTTMFFWEKKIKDMMKYWGFTETYTYSLVGEDHLGNEKMNALKLSNPLQEDSGYLRIALTPSLLEVVHTNKKQKEISIFEIAHVYLKRTHDLPDERLHFSGMVKKSSVSFFEIKGLLEQLAHECRIPSLHFKQTTTGIDISIQKTTVGEIVIHGPNLISWEIDLALFLKNATSKKTYTPLRKFPSVYEDLSVIVDPDTSTKDIIELIESHDPLIQAVTLLDRYEDTRTFHIMYQSEEKNLTSQDITPIREGLVVKLKKHHNAVIK
jgi:phenylalanyl-tRNA synthetase beta chain